MEELTTEDFKSEEHSGEFPGGLVVRIQGFYCRSLGSIPSVGPRAHKPCVRCSQNFKKKNFKCEEDFTRWRNGGKSIQSKKSVACLRAIG